jgi:hypothetical protein
MLFPRLRAIVPSDMRPTAVPAARLAIACVALHLGGCLYTTQHFNSGRLLEPGKTAVTFGLGREQVYSEHCPDGYQSESHTGGTLCRDERSYGGSGDPFDGAPPVYDTALIAPAIGTIILPKFSLSYRLGVRGHWGPFTGVELGWLIEAPTNPGTVEFDLKLGLPLAERFRAQHSLSAGWGVGMWADNSYFLEYAASRDLGPHALYANYRFTWLATQPADLDSSFDNWKFTSHRRYVSQAAFGLYLKMPDWPVLPDYVTPQAIFTFPVVAPFFTIAEDRLEPVLMNFNFGFGWNF